MTRVLDGIDAFLDQLGSVEVVPLLLAIACHLLKMACTSRAWRNVLAAAYPEEPVPWSKIYAAYAGPEMPAAHCSASAMVLPGIPSGARCGQIEKSTRPNVLISPDGGRHWMKSSPTSGVITMLPALSPTHTVSLSEGNRWMSPDSRIQWHR